MNEAEGCSAEREGDICRFSGIDVDTFECLQRFDGSRRIVLDSLCNLSRFVSIAFAGVAEFEAERHVIGFGDRRRGRLCVAIFEGRIAQAIAERIDRLFRHVTIGAALHVVVAEVRQLVDGFIECDGQTTCGIVIAEEHIGNGRAGFLTTVPSIDDGVGLSFPS